MLQLIQLSECESTSETIPNRAEVLNTETKPSSKQTKLPEGLILRLHNFSLTTLEKFYDFQDNNFKIERVICYCSWQRAKLEN